MIVEITDDARDKIENLYADFPDVGKRDMQLIEDLLYHVSHNQSFQIGTSHGHLVMTAINRKSRPWDK